MDTKQIICPRHKINHDYSCPAICYKCKGIKNHNREASEDDYYVCAWCDNTLKNTYVRRLRHQGTCSKAPGKETYNRDRCRCQLPKDEPLQLYYTPAPPSDHRQQRISDIVNYMPPPPPSQ